jgi:hypothetical protein
VGTVIFLGGKKCATYTFDVPDYGAANLHDLFKRNVFPIVPISVDCVRVWTCGIYIIDDIHTYILPLFTIENKKTDSFPIILGKLSVFYKYGNITNPC